MTYSKHTRTHVQLSLIGMSYTERPFNAILVVIKSTYTFRYMFQAVEKSMFLYDFNIKIKNIKINGIIKFLF